MSTLSQSLIEKIPFPPYLTGIVVSIACFIGYLLIADTTGLLARTLSGDIPSTSLRAGLTLMILVGYMPIAHWYLRKWTGDHIGDLNVKFNLADERRVPEEWILILLGLSGWAAFIVLFLILPDPSGFLTELWKWSPDFTAIIVVMSIVGWFMGRFSYELVWSAIEVAKMASRLPTIDLLETEAYKPFTQHGVHSALLVVIMMSITAHLAAQPGSGLVGAIVNMSTMIALAIISLVLPVRGMHLRIRDQKQEELQVLRMHIRQEQGQVLEGMSTTSDRLIGLLAMEARIERVYEWPFDVGSLSKVGLYLMLGLGSWVGAALVERMLESAL